MIDFSKLKSMTIPEGAVSRLLWGGKVLWEKTGLPCIVWYLNETYDSAGGYRKPGGRSITDIFYLSSTKDVQFAVTSCRYAINCYDAAGTYLGQLSQDRTALVKSKTGWSSAGTMTTYSYLKSIDPAVAKISLIAEVNEIPGFVMEYVPETAELDFANYELKFGCITMSSNTWQSTESNKHCMIPLSDFEGYNTVTITANDNLKAYVSFLMNDQVVDKKTPPYAEGWTAVHVMEVGTTETFQIPADATILFFNATNAAGNSLLPKSVVFSN